MISEPLSKSQPSTTETKPQKVTSHLGVDLSAYESYELKNDPVYQKFNSSNIHFAINAMQKGLKPPTQIGLKRAKKKHFKRKLKNLPRTPMRQKSDEKDQEQTTQQIQKLIPKCPEQTCLKALRAQFRQRILESLPKAQPFADDPVFSSLTKPKLTQQQKDAKRKPKFIRKKLRQQQRRLELITLIKENIAILRKIIPAERLASFSPKSRCPKISRQEVREALTKYYQQQIDNVNNPSYIAKIIEENKQKKNENDKRKRNFRDFQRNHRDQYDRSSLDAESQLLRSSSNSSDSSDRNDSSDSEDSIQEQV